MNCTRILFLLIILPFMVLTGKAQTNIAFYTLEEQFNSANFNPAFLTSQKNFSISFFPLGGTSVGYNNQEAIKQLVTKFISGKTSDDDYKEILRSMTDRPSNNQNIESTLLTFTFRSNVGYFNFRIKENEIFSTRLKGDLTDFIIKPGIQSAVLNQIQDLPAQGMHYREFSLGYSMPAINNKFTAGIRAKLYFGKSAFFSGISGSIYPELSDYTLKTQGVVKISMPDVEGIMNSKSAISGSSAVKYLMNSGNPGFGVDLGFNYRIIPDLTLSMSVIDLGKINWKTNLNSKSFNAEYKIRSSNVVKGVNEFGQETITKNFDNSSFTDSISNIFDLNPDSTSFSKQMPLSIYAGLNYRINPKFKISLVNRYMYIKDMSQNSFAVLADIAATPDLSFSAGYAIIGNSYVNIPVALLFKREFGQIYIGTDNMAAFLIPSVSDYAGISFGTCFYLFQKRDLWGKISKQSIFYKPKKGNRKGRHGLILKEYPEF
jgi:hypothetical protein